MDYARLLHIARFAIVNFDSEYGPVINDQNGRMMIKSLLSQRIDDLITRGLLRSLIAVVDECGGVISVVTSANVSTAVRTGQLHVLQWLIDTGHGVRDSVFIEAATYGQLDTIRWLHEYYNRMQPLDHHSEFVLPTPNRVGGVDSVGMHRMLAAAILHRHEEVVFWAMDTYGGNKIPLIAAVSAITYDRISLVFDIIDHYRCNTREEIASLLHAIVHSAAGHSNLDAVSTIYNKYRPSMTPQWRSRVLTSVAALALRQHDIMLHSWARRRLPVRGVTRRRR